MLLAAFAAALTLAAPAAQADGCERHNHDIEVPVGDRCIVADVAPLPPIGG